MAPRLARGVALAALLLVLRSAAADQPSARRRLLDQPAAVYSAVNTSTFNLPSSQLYMGTLSPWQNSTGTSFDGGPDEAAAVIFFISGLVVDKTGLVYFSDLSGAIRSVTAEGNITTGVAAAMQLASARLRSLPSLPTWRATR